MTAPRSPLRILTVCTANVCRSPVVERLLARHLADHGVDAVVASAGTHGGRLDVHPHTSRAAATLGIELDDHRSRAVAAPLLHADGADLVLTMTREHLRDVVGLEPAVWPRAFTLREAVRRGSQLGPVAAVGTFEQWRTELGNGRRAADLMRPDPSDDLADPYGGPAAGHQVMVTEVDALTSMLARLLAGA